MKKITLFNDYNVDSKIYKIYKEEFYKKKNNSYYFSIFTIVGTVFVFALKNIPIGLCLGVVIGIALDYQKKMLANTPASTFIIHFKFIFLRYFTVLSIFISRMHFKFI